MIHLKVLLMTPVILLIIFYFHIVKIVLILYLNLENVMKKQIKCQYLIKIVSWMIAFQNL